MGEEVRGIETWEGKCQTGRASNAKQNMYSDSDTFGTKWSQKNKLIPRTISAVSVGHVALCCTGDGPAFSDKAWFSAEGIAFFGMLRLQSEM